jgi:hypothetical protein
VLVAAAMVRMQGMQSPHLAAAAAAAAIAATATAVAATARHTMVEEEPLS